MHIRASQLAFFSLISGLALSGCQTTSSGSSEGLTSDAPQAEAPRVAITQRRDDAASDAVMAVYIERATLKTGAGTGLTEAEHRAVLREVDRQICFEVSERFAVVAQPGADAAIVRTSVTRILPTGRVGSGASAVANVFNPLPIVNFRAPGSLGGLTVESELLAPGTNEQIAAITWARDVKVVGTVSPSLSPIGDALQLAEPMGDAVGAAFATKTRKAGKVKKPDPCQAFGPRQKVTTNGVAGAVTGLYIPEKEAAD